MLYDLSGHYVYIAVFTNEDFLNYNNVYTTMKKARMAVTKIAEANPHWKLQEVETGPTYCRFSIYTHEYGFSYVYIYRTIIK